MELITNFIRILFGHHADVVFVTAYIFDVPRYLLSTIALSIAGIQSLFQKGTYRPRISVLLPLYNGEKNLISLLRCLRTQSLKPFEIIIIDDGSTDNTKRIALWAHKIGIIDQFASHPQRCGKSPSLNHALRFSSGDIVLTIDDDTLLDNDAIERLAAVFEDPSVSIASGNISITNNSDSIWTSIQSIEYLLSITIGRSFLNTFGAVACCSGAFCMIRADILHSTGGFNVGPGEDLEITLRMHRLGFKVEHVVNAYASVDGPETFSGLVRQRIRWDRDALNIRFNMYQGYSFFQNQESISSAIQYIDFIVFEFIPTIIFPFYLAYISAFYGMSALPYLSAIYVTMLTIYITNIIVGLIAARNKVNLFDLIILPILPLYQGVIMKLIRFYAFSTEILFSSSQSDDFVPYRVRKALYGKDEYL